MLTPELHARYRARIGRRVTAIFGSDHENEDFVQEVLITVLTKIDTVRNPACLDGWVHQVTMNVLRNVMRQRRCRRRVLGELSTALKDGAFPENHDAAVVASRAMGLTNRLSAKERRLLAAHWFSTQRKEVIAAELGCSPNTLRRRVTRARARFEKLARRDPALVPYLDGRRPRD